MLDRLILILCFTLNLLVTLVLATAGTLHHFVPAGREQLWAFAASWLAQPGVEQGLGPAALAVVAVNLFYLVVILGRPADGGFLSLPGSSGIVRVRRSALLASLRETVKGLEGVRKVRVKLREEGAGRFRVRVSLEAAARETLGPLTDQIRSRVGRRLEEMVKLSSPDAVVVEVEVRGFGRFEQG